jgi:hypothetical protein
MRELWIFGDSFGDPTFGDPTYGNQYNYKRWWQYLEGTHNVTNFCETGTGPRYMLTKLYKQIGSVENTDNIDLLFLCSEMHRIHLKSIPPQFSHKLRKVDNLEGLPFSIKKAIWGSRKHYYWMRKEYWMTDSWKLEQLMIYNMLYTLKDLFHKVFVWQVFKPVYVGKEMQHGEKQNLNLLLSANDNWHLEMYPMAKISFENCNMVTKKSIDSKVPDPRLNHLGKDISKSVGEELISYFDTGKFDLNNLMSYRSIYNF